MRSLGMAAGHEHLLGNRRRHPVVIFLYITLDCKDKMQLRVERNKVGGANPVSEGVMRFSFKA